MKLLCLFRLTSAANPPIEVFQTRGSISCQDGGRAIFHTLFEVLPNSMRANSQRVHRNIEFGRQLFAMCDFLALFFFIVADNELPVLVRQRSQAIIEALKTGILFVIIFKIRRRNFSHVLCQLVSLLHFPQGLQQYQVRRLVEISRDVRNRLPFVNSSHNAIEGIICARVRRVAATPFEKSQQL